MSKNFFKILRAGINSTFQDKGRKNLYHIGIPFSGAMDNRNFQISKHPQISDPTGFRSGKLNHPLDSKLLFKSQQSMKSGVVRFCNITAH